MNNIFTHARTLAFTALVFALMNAPFWVASNYIFINRPLFSYDLLVALIVSLYSVRLSFLLVVCTFLVDALSISALTYQFSGPIDFIKSSLNIGSLQLSKWFNIANIFSVVIFTGVLFYVWILLRIFACTRKVKLATSVFLLCSIFLVDILVGSSIFYPKDSIVIARNFAGSGIFSLIVSEIKDVPSAYSNRKVTHGESAQDLFDIGNWAKQNPDRSILFVVVESLGYSTVDDVNAWIAGPMFSKGYDVRSGAVPFKGATTSGELRSLCRISASYLTVRAADTSDCLPNYLSSLGWSTTSYHGFSKAMFDRLHWWLQIGFQKTKFVEDFILDANNSCGSLFRGLCDFFLIDQAVSELKKPKQFVYVLTLDTHLPVSSKILSRDALTLCRRHHIAETPCMHIQNLRATISSIMTSINVLPKKPLVVVVGDHAPPFSKLEYRNLFSEIVVPAFVLLPVSEN